MNFMKKCVIESAIKSLGSECHEIAKRKGFYEGLKQDHRAFGLRLMQTVGELSEALEALREGKEKREVEEELADTFIRLLDLCEFFEYDIGRAVINKLDKNSKRSYLHGKNF